MKILPLLLLLSLVICQYNLDFLSHPENIQVKKKTDKEKEEIVKNVKYRMDNIEVYDKERIETLFYDYPRSCADFTGMWYIFPNKKRLGMVRLIVNELSGSGKINILNTCKNYMDPGNDELLSIYSQIFCIIGISMSIEEYNK